MATDGSNGVHNSGASGFVHDETCNPTFYPQQETSDHLDGKTFKRITIRDPNDNNRDITAVIFGARMNPLSNQQSVTENVAPEPPEPIKITAPTEMEPDTDPCSKTQQLKKSFPKRQGQLLFCMPPEGQKKQQNKEAPSLDFQPKRILKRTEKLPSCILMVKEEDKANKAASTSQPETDVSISPKTLSQQRCNKSVSFFLPTTD